jgi:hypothetical protein
LTCSSNTQSSLICPAASFILFLLTPLSVFSQSDGRIILLKVDSEGAEGRIFTGSQQLLESVDIVLFEIGEAW